MVLIVVLQPVLSKNVWSPGTWGNICAVCLLWWSPALTTLRFSFQLLGCIGFAFGAFGGGWAWLTCVWTRSPRLPHFMHFFGMCLGWRLVTKSFLKMFEIDSFKIEVCSGIKWNSGWTGLGPWWKGVTSSVHLAEERSLYVLLNAC